MNKAITILSLCIAVLFLQSCGGDSGLTLTVSTPTEGQSFAPGDVIPIAGTTSDDVAISSIQFTISRLGINETFPGMLNQREDFLLNVTIDPMTPLEDDIEIVVVSFDDEGNTEEVKRKINIR